MNRSRLRLSDLPAAFGFLWSATRGYRLAPWKSPYLRWRVETYSGIPAETLERPGFWAFSWKERASLTEFVAWAARMRRTFR